MPVKTIEGYELKILKRYPRKSKITGRITLNAHMDLSVDNSRLLEVDQALQILKSRKPQLTISALICNAIIEAAKKPMEEKPDPFSLPTDDPRSPWYLPPGEPDYSGPARPQQNMHQPYYPEGAPQTLKLCKPLLDYCRSDDPAAVREAMGEEQFRTLVTCFDGMLRAGYSIEEWKSILKRADFTDQDMNDLVSLIFQLRIGVDAQHMAKEVEAALKPGPKKV
jgi:hypothetical protein